MVYTNAEEAVNLYTSLFKESNVTKIVRYPDSGPGPAGAIMTIEFELFGQQFIALNGGPRFQFNESVSFVVNCDTQEEIDKYWNALLEGGKAQQCGWLKDKFGLSWQIVPSALGKYMADSNKERSQRVFHAMMKMVKFDIAVLQRAYEGQS